MKKLHRYQINETHLYWNDLKTDRFLFIYLFFFIFFSGLKENIKIENH